MSQPVPGSIAIKPPTINIGSPPAAPTVPIGGPYSPLKLPDTIPTPTVSPPAASISLAPMRSSASALPGVSVSPPPTVSMAPPQPVVQVCNLSNNILLFIRIY